VLSLPGVDPTPSAIFVVQQVRTVAQSSLGVLLARRVDGTVVQDLMVATRSEDVTPMAAGGAYAEMFRPAGGRPSLTRRRAGRRCPAGSPPAGA
jgi:hypothetical protein